MNSVLLEIQQERIRQDIKWGQQNHDAVYWLAILAEEFGEAAKEAVEYNAVNNQYGGLTHKELKHLKNLREELVQTAAVAVSFIESLDRNELK